MAKLRLKLKTTLVNDTAGKVNIKFNSTALDNDVTLTTNDTTLEYDVTVSDTNTLQIDLINAWAFNYDSTTNTWEQAMSAIVDEISYSTDNSTYISVIPQDRTFFTSTAGPLSGPEVTLKPQIDSVKVYGTGFLIEFDSNGLLNQPDFTLGTKPYNPVATWDGTTYTSPTGDAMSKEEKFNIDNT